MSTGWNILVVDDDDDVRDMIVEYLETHAFSVYAAEGRERMREVLAEQEIDLVLLDRTMPGGDSMELVPELREGYGVAVIMVTALGADKERVAGLERGADDYVTKPFNWRELVARINSVIRRTSVAAKRASASAPSPHESAEAKKGVERRETAVMFADVAGYVRLMRDDEEATLRDWWALRNTIIDPAIAARDGRIVKLTGDGFLAEFATVDDAIATAVDIQNRVGAWNSEVPETRHMRFRMGVNWCTVVAEGGDIYGDGVNLASRLEEIAEAGGICVSDDARQQVKMDGVVTFEPVEERHLKHIPEPIRAFRLAWRRTGGADTASIDPPSPLRRPALF